MRYQNPHPPMQQHGQPQMNQHQDPLQLMMQQHQMLVKQLQQVQQQLQMSSHQISGPQQVMLMQQQQMLMQQLQQLQMQIQNDHRSSQIMQQQMQPMVGGRFGTQQMGGQPTQMQAGVGKGMYGNNQAMSGMQTQQDDSGRFGSQAVPKMEVEMSMVAPEPEVFQIPEFEVNINPVTFPHNEKLAIRVRQNRVDSNAVHHKPVTVMSFDMAEAIDSLKEELVEVDGGEQLCVSEVIEVEDCITHERSEALVGLFQDDARNLYRRMKNCYREAKVIDEVLLLDRINDIFTDKINDYLLINFGDAISIDSFIMDFNDLLKAIRNNFDDDEEDLLLNYLEQYIEQINEAIDLHRGAETEESDKFCILKPYLMVYLEGYGYSTGLKEVKDMVKVTDSPNNEFLTSLVNHIYKTYQVPEFLLACRDGIVYKFFQSQKGEIVVKRVK